MNNKQKNGIPKISPFNRFTAWFFNTLKSGFFGYLFTSYERVNERFSKRFKKRNFDDAVPKQDGIRRNISSKIERNRLLKALSSVPGFMLRVSTRDYGIALLTMGSVISALYLIQQYVEFLHIGFPSFIGGIIITVLSLPFFFSSKSISQTVISRKFLSRLLFDFFGMKQEFFRVQSEKDKKILSLFALLIGLIFAVGAYFLSPVKILLIILTFIFFCAILDTPETGVILSIFLLPFANVFVISICVLYTSFCFGLKFILRKRIFKFEYFGLWISILIAGVLICSLFTANFDINISSLLLSLLFIASYFTVSNLVRSREWYKRSIKSFTASSSIASVIFIGEIILKNLEEHFDIIDRLKSVSDNIYMFHSSIDFFAMYLSFVIPFILVYMISSKKEFRSFLGFVSLALSGSCLVLTYNGYAILGCIVAVLLILMIFHRNFLYLSLSLVIAFPLLYFLLPENIVNSFMVKFNISGGQTIGRVSHFRSVINMIKERPWGYGFTDAPFKESSVELGVQHANSLYLQIAVTCGVLGLIVFIGFIFVMSQFMFSYIVKSKNKYRKINGAVGFCSVVGFLCVGLFDNVWLDKRLMFMFFVCIALFVAYVRIEREDIGATPNIVDISSANIDIKLCYNIPKVSVPKRTYVRIPKIRKQPHISNSYLDTSEYDTKEFIRVMSDKDAEEDVQNEQEKK